MRFSPEHIILIGTRFPGAITILIEIPRTMQVATDLVLFGISDSDLYVKDVDLVDF
jgi:hypothetical protein